jgi:RNA polymerase sigma factor (sigma-70 family)
VTVGPARIPIEVLEAHAEVGARAGDQAAFAELLGPWILPAANFAYGLLHDRQEAEDAVQEAALKAWRKLHTLRRGAPFGPWFLGIVAHQCRSTRRGRWFRLIRHPEPERLVSGAPAAEPAAYAELARAILDLDDRRRAAIVLHYYLDMPVDQVAQVLGITQAGVKSRLNRALKSLRPLLEGPP